MTARKLLIADDSASMRSAIVRCCARPDDVIIEAANGVEAVELFAQHQPDWAIMDIQMPVMDGLAAVRSIRRQFPQARIAVVTQFDEPVWEQESFAAGARAFFSKDDLTRIEQFLNTSSGAETTGDVEAIASSPHKTEAGPRPADPQSENPSPQSQRL